MQHWLGEAVVDRLVFRILKANPGLTGDEITSRVCATLKEDGIVKDFQIPPDGECIYRTLVRFVMSGTIENTLIHDQVLSGIGRTHTHVRSRKGEQGAETRVSAFFNVVSAA